EGRRIADHAIIEARTRVRNKPTAAVRSRSAPSESDVEAELDHVAVLHDVVLALHAGLPSSTRSGHGPEVDEIGVPDDLGLDEATLEVGVDDAGGLGRRGALLDGPGTGLLGPSGEVRLQAQGVEPDAGELVQARLVLTHGLQQLEGVLVRHLDELGLD